MSCVEGEVVAQVPGPNQYWEHIKSKDRAYFIGRDPDGRLVWQCEGDCIEVGNLDWSGWRHIPGCTGWDWEPDQVEEYPQYWTTRNSFSYLYVVVESPTVWKAVTTAGNIEDWNHRVFDSMNRTRLTEQEALALLDKPADRWPKYYVPTTAMVTHRSDSPVAYFRRDRQYVHDETNGETFLIDGASFVWNEWTQLDNVQEVTEADAKARVTKAAEPAISVQFLPVAPEMDWVDLPGDHVLRRDIDWIRTIGPWQQVLGLAGRKVSDLPLKFARCLRKDLPVVESPEDWVVQDSVEARPGIDQGWWAYDEQAVDYGAFKWWGVSSTDMVCTKKHGYCSYDGLRLYLRCRRKDLPPVPAPVEETFPQWYILKDDEKRSWVPDWTVKRTGEETSIRYARDEAGELYATNEQWTGAAECWQRCSALEAYDRLGTRILPDVPSEQRRVPVKLWVTHRLADEGGDWPVRATQSDQTCQNWKEIKFDGNGAFIEVEQ